MVDASSLAPSRSLGDVLGAAPEWAFLVLVVILLVILAGGLVAGAAVQRGIDDSKKNRNRARWPRDWPKLGEIFTRDRDPAKPGYLTGVPKRVAGSGDMPLGRTYPRWKNPIPNVYPLRGLHRWFDYLVTKPVWIPYEKRFQHFGVLGKTGGGKSTSYAVPILAYGALEQESSYFAIDVKSPAFAKMFGRLYRGAGKEVLFIDPWSPTETLAFEPLWRASPEELDQLAEAIISYSATGGKAQSSDNSQFFKDAAVRTLRGILDLAQFWPRKYCNLPCVRQLVGAGGDAMVEAFQNAPRLLPSEDEFVRAALAVAAADAEGLGAPAESGGHQRDRSPEIQGALRVVDRSGFKTAYLIRRMRQYEEAHAAGRTDPHLGLIDDAKIAEVREAFERDLRAEYTRRRSRLERLLMTQGEFISMPDDTRNSVVSTLTNKVAWFRERHIAQAFSRDELDPHILTKRPCLLLAGAPMAKLQEGSLFVASILSNLAIKSVFMRGMALERQKAVSDHGVFFLLDEFPQLQLHSAPQVLATFRGFKGGCIMIFQDRGQLKTLYADDYTTMESNMVHKVLFPGAHEDACEFYAKSIGEAQVVKRSKSGAKGEKQNVSESIENMPLMSMNDLKYGKLNGEVKGGVAFNIGSDVPAFPLRLVPFYDDPFLRKLLGLKRQLKRKGWRFWKWAERWNPPENAEAYLTRMAEPAYDPDDLEQIAGYILGVRRYYPRLEEPQLKPKAVGVGGVDVAGPTSAPAAEPALQAPKKQEPLSADELVPTYGDDIRSLLNTAFREPAPVREQPPIGGSLRDRTGTYESTPIDE